MPVYGERSTKGGGRNGQRRKQSGSNKNLTQDFIKWPYNILVPSVSYTAIPPGVTANPDTLVNVDLSQGYNVIFNYSGVVKTNVALLALPNFANPGIYFEGKAMLYRFTGEEIQLFWRLEPFSLLAAQNYDNAPVSSTNPTPESGIDLLYSMLNVPQASCLTYTSPPPNGQPFDEVFYPGDKLVILNPRIKTNNPPVESTTPNGSQLQSTGGPNIYIQFD